MKDVASLHLGSTNCTLIENATALKEFAEHYGTALMLTNVYIDINLLCQTL